MIKTKQLFLLVFLTGILFSQCTNKSVHDYQWGIIPAVGEVVGRHENVFIEYKDKFYLIGGRGINPVNVYDPKTNLWETNPN